MVETEQGRDLEAFVKASCSTVFQDCLETEEQFSKQTTSHASRSELSPALPLRLKQGRARRSADAIQQAFETPCAPFVLGKKLGEGAFGQVYRSHTPDGQVCAVKQFVHDPAFANREVQICRMLAEGNHPNCVEVLHTYAQRKRSGERLISIVMEYLPHSLRGILCFLSERDMRMKICNLRLYTFQLARALVFLHMHEIIHRDVKPDNILVHPHTHVLKLADFGSAKQMPSGTSSTTYICSRFYRAPELILDRDLYGPAVDMWSFGCILAEVAVGSPFFVGDSNAGQLVEQIRVLGTFTNEDTDDMAASPKNTLGKVLFPARAPVPWPKALTITHLNGKRTKGSFGKPFELMLGAILTWRPTDRLTAVQVLAHPFLDGLRTPSSHTTELPDDLFDFTAEEHLAIGALMPQVIGASPEPSPR